MVKKILLILTLVGMIALPGAAAAAPFPDKTDEVVQDAAGYLNSEDRERFIQTVKELPDVYKVVVVDSIRPEAETPDEYAQKLYDNYNLSEDALMIVLDKETGELGVHAGPALAAKGATSELLREKIEAYYEPFRMQQEHMKGIELFVTEVDAELNPLFENGSAASPDLPAAASDGPQPKSLWALLPWWLYACGLALLTALIASVILFSRRRRVYGEIDELEEAKDGLVEKIQLLEVDRPLRRASGTTEERYAELANHKENLLRIRIPDVEMIILEAEEACDRFRFGMARGLLAEGWQLLDAIEQEAERLKEDALQLAQAQKVNRDVLPEIGKAGEALERKLTHFRLEYGMPFHQLKSQLDELEKLRAAIKTALADGDGLRGHELSVAAQSLADKLVSTLERIPQLVTEVTKHMPRKLRQLEQDIATVGDAFDLNQNHLDTSLLQLKQLLIAATTALEEGDIGLAETHRKAFAVKVDAVYGELEQSAVSRREAAAAAHSDSLFKPLDAAPTAVERPPGGGTTAVAVAADAELVQDGLKPAALEAPVQAEAASPAAEAFAELGTDTAESAGEAVGRHPLAEPGEQADDRLGLAAESAAPDGLSGRALPDEATATQPEHQPEQEWEAVSSGERDILWDKRPSTASPEMARQAAEAGAADDTLLELVIENEDDALDEMERISQSLLRIRQKIKRSYLPGVPDAVKMHFDQVVQALTQTKRAMEEFGYDWQEIALLLKEAHELLAETERVTEQVIAMCQRAEGAIQYTNRYRRVNRRVNELLTQAEQSFRQLRFEEALYLAEKARLIVEGEPSEKEERSRWQFRRKKRGADG